MFPALLALSLSAGPAAPSDLTGARARIEGLVGRSGAEVSVAFRTLDHSTALFLEPDRSFHAASTMKIAVMIELYAQARAGKLDLDEPLAVHNGFSSMVDGSPYALDPKSDSEPLVYQSVGGTLPLRRLCESMIAVSSNLATNLLLERLGVEAIRRQVHALGADGLEIVRGLEDSKAFLAGLNNTTTARALLVLLEGLAQGRVVDEAASREMVEILKAQRFKEAIPQGVPAGVAVAHKTGEITKIHHDAAIVFAERPFVLVVLVRGIEDSARSAGLIADITRSLYDAVEPPEDP